MVKAVLDSTVLVSAFLAATGVSRELLYRARAGDFEICLSDEILDETQRVLNYSRIRKRYAFSDDDVAKYIHLLRLVASLVNPQSPVSGIVRDPNDDMILACAIESRAPHIVSRDKDLLILGNFEKIGIVSPENYMAILRRGP